MDVLVLLEECDDELAGRPRPANRPAGGRPLAYVHSTSDVPAWSGMFGGRGPASGREVITLCGGADAGRLAVALAAAVEGRRAGPVGAVRHLGVWDGLGVSGDSAWRDQATGQLVSRAVAIPAHTIEATARQLLLDFGRVIQRTAAELGMPEWPEGARRAISFALPVPGEPGPARFAAADGDDALLASLREADGYAEAYYDDGGD